MEWNRGTGAWIYVQVINIPFKLFKATTRLSLESNNNELVTISKILSFISSIIYVRTYVWMYVLKCTLCNRMELNVLMLNTRHSQILHNIQIMKWQFNWVLKIERIWFFRLGIVLFAKQSYIQCIIRKYLAIFTTWKGTLHYIAWKKALL